MDQFAEIWLIDSEFFAPPGERPEPLCLVAREFRSGRTERLWRDDLHDLPQPPFSVGPETLFVAYYASAELGCFLALGWPLPARMLDLFAEFRRVTNGLSVPCGNGLLGALAYFGIDGVDAAEKGSMRDLAMRGGSYTAGERAALVNYCESDVAALGKLLEAMYDWIDLPRALLRGRYMAAAARIEWTGVPIDVQNLSRLRDRWGTIKRRLIDEVDRDFGVYRDGHFSVEAFEAYLGQNSIPWPRLNSGALDLKQDKFRQMARQYPAVAPLRELRHSLSQLRLNDLAVGSDGRNRCLLSAFQARTGRNQPSNSRFIFGPSVWLRGLIRPEPGRALAYVDWSQQEFGIAAALSGDPAMMTAYRSGDPYLEFARQARAVPEGATKKSHGAIREQFKTCALGTLYGMEARSLAASIGEPEIVGRELLRLHRQTYPKFWSWSQSGVDHAMFRGWLQTVFGWTIRIGTNANPRSLANFSMQANGAEMLRLACCLATEQGIQVCAPVHDALLVEGPIDEIEEVVAATQAAMREASAVVLGGFELRADAAIVRHPDRYMDSRGKHMWETVMGLLESIPAGCLPSDGCGSSCCIGATSL